MSELPQRKREKEEKEREKEKRKRKERKRKERKKEERKRKREEGRQLIRTAAVALIDRRRRDTLNGSNMDRWMEQGRQAGKTREREKLHQS